MTASEKKSKRSRYRIADEFLRSGSGTSSPTDRTSSSTLLAFSTRSSNPTSPTHVSTTFEDVCRDALRQAVRRGQMHGYARIGPWWHGGEEIDIVALAPDDERSLFAECKWTAEPVGLSLAEELRAKADDVRWGSSSRKQRYALLSRSGFEDGLEDALDEDWSLFTLEDLDALFSAR